MRYLKTLASAVAVVMLLVMATDYVAMAATGKPVILGKVNKSGKTTTIKSTKGAALSLKAKAGQAPLKVNQSTLVSKLNADQVDGKSANQLGVRTRLYSLDLPAATRSSFVMTLPDVPAGTYLATMDGWIYGTNASTMHCYLRTPDGTDRPQDYLQSSNTFYAISASGIITVSETADLPVRCQGSSGSWSTYQDFQVSLTTIDAVTNLPSTFVKPSVAGRSAATQD